MPPARRDGAQLGTEHRPDALNATTATSITRSSVRGRQQRAWPQISRAIRFGRAGGAASARASAALAMKDAVRPATASRIR